MQPFSEHVEICTNHEQCEERRGQIKMTKGFVAKEPVKGHMASLSLIVIPLLFFSFSFFFHGDVSLVSIG